MVEFLEGEKRKIDALLKNLKEEVVIPAGEKNFSAKDALKQLKQLKVPILKKIG